MFFIIPIGSELGVRRLPLITLGLIVVNTVVWIITAFILQGQVKEIQGLHRSLWDIERGYTFTIIGKDPTLLQRPVDERFHAAFAADSIISPSDPNLRTWNDLYARFETAKQNVIFEKVGLKPSGFSLLTLLTSMFVHANFLHLLFNMLFLWLVGCNIEDGWGRAIFLGLYLVSGAAAALFHVATFPHSHVPLIGASGAIAGVMGAYMIRHFKNKVRLLWFIWLFIRPYFGTFSVYAGLALPVWFLVQIFSSSWSSGVRDSGPAYLAHVGGFIFGVAVGFPMKFLGWEKKYVAPRIEDSFEKLKLSPAMKAAHARMEVGDAAGAVPLFLQAINENPGEVEARLLLARIHLEQGRPDEARTIYDQALGAAMSQQDGGWVAPIYEELKEKGLLDALSENNCYRLASYLEKDSRFEDAVKVYDGYIRRFPGSGLRPKAIYREHLLWKEKLKDEAKAQAALSLLQKEYPGWLQALG